jgi:hypothetical protein
MKSFKSFLTEIFDSPAHYSLWNHNQTNPIYRFVVGDYTYLAGFTHFTSLGGYNFGFAIYTESGEIVQTVTNVGAKSAAKVFATSLAIIREFIKNNDPKVVIMLADLREPTSKISVYNMMIKKYVPDNYSYTSKTVDFEGTPHIKYIFTKR